jgi:hypothetical protein
VNRYGGSRIKGRQDRVSSGDVGQLFGSGRNCNFIKRYTEIKVESMIISSILHEPILKNKAQP